MNQYANDFTNTVRVYYDELKKYKPLTKSKEKRLLKLCKRGNIKAKNELLEANLRFVFDVAKRYSGRGVPISDLISEGNMGLLKAIDKFDETKDVKFISYAVWWIRQSMLDAIKKSKLVTFTTIDTDENGNNSIDKKLFDSEDEFVSNNDSAFSNESEERKKETNDVQKEIIAKLLSSLNEREKEIIENYYGINGKKEMTLTEIGEEYSLSSERVRQIKKTSLRKLRSNVLLFEEYENLFG